MAPDGDAERGEEHLFGLTGEEWVGVLSGLATGAVLLWVTADFHVAVRGLVVLTGLVVGPALGIAAVRSLRWRPATE